MGVNGGKAFSSLPATRRREADTRYAWLYSKDNKGDGKQDKKTENKEKRYFTGIMQVLFIKCVACLET